MRYFSMFSGIGGFELAILRAFNNEHAHIGEESEPEERPQRRIGTADKPGVLVRAGDRPAPLCVGYSEIDKYAIQTYERHFKHDNYGSATDINPANLPGFDLLVGGFPCQAFSIAGKRLGFDDTRGTLFFDIARILSHKRPRHLVLENVKGLLSHDQGKTLQTIVGVLAGLGYRIEWQVLNSKDFGVPQNRERIYVVGHLGDGCGGQVFPIRRSSTEYPENEQVKRLLKRHRQGVTGDDSYTLDAIQTNGIAIRTRTYANQPPKLEARTDRLSNTINSVPKDYMATDGVKIRRLTPKECERLQGFPDGWTAGVSDTQRYKQCGNAVTVNVVEVVVTGLSEAGCI